MVRLKVIFGDIIHPKSRKHAIMADLLSQYVVSHLKEQPSAATLNRPPKHNMESERLDRLVAQSGPK